ncbi:uncharacterized protein JCM6883_001179 [Sporobolomyces salmoneus]|uniref:uncharacterized protein n=1 Tax=Sporobolomyces salmoneus TaxID=183962 RepID=UPI00317BC842
MDPSNSSGGSQLPSGSNPLHPSPSPISAGFPPSRPHHSTSSSTSTSYQSSSSSSLLPSLPVGIEATLNSGPQASSSQVFPPPIIPFDPNAASDDDDEEEEVGSPRKKRRATNAKNGKGSGAEGNGANADEKGRRKIEIEYIQKKEKRHITFSKRKAGIMKKAYELATLTGTQVLLLVVSETGIVYTFTTTKFQPLVGAGENGQPSEGQRLIQKCLAVDPSDTDGDFISPPPDGPLLPLPPSAQKRPFEANSPIHGGQIALRTKQQRPRKKPAPIVPPPSTSNVGRSSHPPTPGIHTTLDGLPIPPSPHHVHPLNQAPLPSPGHQQHPQQMRDYPPPSPSYPPGPNGQRDPPSVLQSGNNYNEMMERSSMNHGGGIPQYGPPSNYPPPPALGYTHTVPNPNRPPHPLDPYPHHQQQNLHQSHNSPNSSPQPRSRYLQAPQSNPYPPSSAAPRSLAGPNNNGQDPYGGGGGGDHRMQYVDDPQMMMHPGSHGGPPPPPDMYMQQQSQPGNHMQAAPQQHHRMYNSGGGGGGNDYGQSQR